MHGAQQTIDERFACEPRVLHHRRERRIREARGRNVVEADDRHGARHIDAALLQRAQRADRDQIARRDDRIERLAARQQLARGFVARLLHRDRVDLQAQRRPLAPAVLSASL